MTFWAPAFPAGAHLPPFHEARLRVFMLDPDPLAPMPEPDRYSRFVRVMRAFLPAVAFGLLGTVLVHPFVGRLAEPSVRALEHSEPPAERTHVIGGHFFGTDEKNRPYEMTAESAVSEDTRGARIRLRSPDSRLYLGAGKSMTLRSQEGLYVSETKRIELFGGVQLEDGTGLVVETEAAEADLETKTARGDAAAHARSPHGTLIGEGFRFDSAKGTLTVTGKSRLILADPP